MHAMAHNKKRWRWSLEGNTAEVKGHAPVSVYLIYRQYGTQQEIKEKKGNSRGGKIVRNIAHEGKRDEA